VKAVIKDSEEIEAKVSICRVDWVWMVFSVREARAAEGRRAREGRVMDEIVYDVPYRGS
jgi:hypothetical protein